jgi:argininosuccinate lyase
MGNNSKLWEGRFTKKASEILDDFNQSLIFDKELFPQDIEASKIHAQMLGKQGIITPDEAEKIINGLEQIYINFSERIEDIKNHEDIHSFIEAELVALIGETGKKLHTGRSRNDQVITALRLWLKNQAIELKNLLQDLSKSLISRAEVDIDCILAGYTHLQQAQAISLGHFWMAHESKLARDIERLEDALKRIDICPLGSGALAGTSFQLDREFCARELGFSGISTNSLDAVSDRDFVCEYEFVLSMIMIHLSQLAEEMIIWNSQEFGYIEIADSHATGSSMMPQKKNPDIPELVRGKTGRVIGVLNALMITLKALPLAYNKDLQEDKELLFMANSTVKKSLVIMQSFLENIKINRDEMYKKVFNSFCGATDIADYLSKSGMAFREAYKLTGKIVSDCIAMQKFPHQLTLTEWRAYHECFSEDIYDFIKPENSVDARDIPGGTSRRQILVAIETAKRKLNV